MIHDAEEQRCEGGEGWCEEEEVGMLTAWIGTDAQERAGRTAGVGRTTTKRNESSCSKKTDKVRGRDEANLHVREAR